MKALVTLLYFIPIIFAKAHQSPTPIVIWHGMGDVCCLPINAGLFKILMHIQLPSIYILSLQIGNSTVEDIENSYLMNPNEQVENVCRALAADVKLAKGFHMVGFSQGSLLLRGVIQRCGQALPPIKNFISLGGPHQGVYGLPHCVSLTNQTCHHIRKMLTFAPYHHLVQSSLVQATYWHDPLNEDVYKRKSIFLADINNELAVNETYKANLKRLQRFVLVKFDRDSMVQPRESEWFGFYAPGQAEELQTLQQSRIYLEDRLGLQKMDKAGKLVFLSQPHDHLQFDEAWFTENIIKKYLV